MTIATRTQYATILLDPTTVIVIKDFQGMVEEEIAVSFYKENHI